MLYRSKSIQKTSNTRFSIQAAAQLSFSSTHTSQEYQEYQEYQGGVGKGAAGCPCREEVGVDGWSRIMNVVLLISITSVAPDAHIKHDHELSVL